MKPRRSTRHTTSLNACYGYPNENLLRPCRIIDISRYGSRIELISRQKFVNGSRVQLHIQPPDCAETIVVMFNCVWSRRTSNTERGSEYQAGGFFYDISPENRDLLLSIADIA